MEKSVEGQRLIIEIDHDLPASANPSAEKSMLTKSVCGCVYFMARLRGYVSDWNSCRILEHALLYIFLDLKCFLTTVLSLVYHDDNRTQYLVPLERSGRPDCHYN